MAYESDVAGTLTEILAEEGETLPIGSPIARVGDSAEATERSDRGACRGGLRNELAGGGDLRAAEDQRPAPARGRGASNPSSSSEASGSKRRRSRGG